MYKYFLQAVAVMAVVLCSCSDNPPESAIVKRVLNEYVCAETSKVDGLKIIKKEKTENMVGETTFQYTVTGEVVWPEGCSEFGTGVQAGSREKFEKVMTIYKNENGEWQ